MDSKDDISRPNFVVQSVSQGVGSNRTVGTLKYQTKCIIVQPLIGIFLVLIMKVQKLLRVVLEVKIFLESSVIFKQYIDG